MKQVSGWIVLSIMCGSTYSWTGTPDSDCVTSDGSLGKCTVPSKCAPPIYSHSVEPVLCRYSRGYEMRICCPRSSLTRPFEYSMASKRDDFYSDDEPIAFPSDTTYTEYYPLIPHTTAAYKPFLFEDPYYQPYNPRPNHPKPSYNEKPYDSNSRPSYHEKPSYETNTRPSYHERPSYETNTRPSYHEKPSYETDTRPSYNKKPSYEIPTYEYEERPKPSYGTQGSTQNSRPSYGVQGNKDRNRPRPSIWGSTEVSSPSLSNRRTTPRPIWAVEGGKRETSSSTKKRISELKCEEYSRPVSQTIDVLPLSIDSEVVPLKFQKCDFSAVKLVVGGEASELGEFPHMAAVGFQSQGSSNVIWNCGGTLISDRFVMTAGHCINTTYGNPVVVRLGEYNLVRDNDGAEPVEYSIERIIVHPNYFKTLKYNDIALLKLSRQVQFNKMIRPACLPTDDSIGSKPVATGWGRTDFVGKLSDILRKVSLSVIDNRECNSFYSTRNPGSASFSSGIVDTMICAGELAGGRDTCLGDSGGPLTVTKSDNPCVHYVVGITSFGKICAAPNSPGVYTRVFKYLPWIERTVWS